MVFDHNTAEAQTLGLIKGQGDGRVLLTCPPSPPQEVSGSITFQAEL